VIERIITRADSRVLGAVQFVDGTTGVNISAELQVNAPNARFIRNLSGAYAVSHHDDLPDYEVEFLEQPAPPPPLGDIKLPITVSDPGRMYMARRTILRIPRDPDPAHQSDPLTLFKMLKVSLYRTPSAPVFPGWSVVRVSVKRQQDKTGLEGAYLRLRKPTPVPAPPPPFQPAVYGRGLTDARGEGVVVVSGVPVTNWDADDRGPVLSSEVDAVLEVYLDRNRTTPPDPDVYEEKRAAVPADPALLVAAPVNLKLASGKEVARRVEISVP
jgi:hypothetical protein